MKSEYLCNLIIPGAGKSGTSSLHAALTAHPQICGSNPKEPQFFSFPERYALGPDHHNAYFSCDGSAKYYCEGSQCYFVHEDAIKRIAESLDNPQIIIMLRDPVDRLLSHYAWNFKRGAEKASLGEAINRALKKSAVAPLVRKRADFSAALVELRKTARARHQRSRREMLSEILFQRPALMIAVKPLFHGK